MLREGAVDSESKALGFMRQASTFVEGPRLQIMSTRPKP